MTKSKQLSPRQDVAKQLDVPLSQVKRIPNDRFCFKVNGNTYATHNKQPGEDQRLVVRIS